jgi:geranylgeranyl diphosphate synthase, type II
MQAQKHAADGIPAQLGPAQAYAPEPTAGGLAIETVVSDLRKTTEHQLAALTPGCPAPPRLGDAMRYSLLAPAKRARAILAQLTAMHWGAPAGSALSAAVALEMVHAASLILDDLPAMDDASLRRGRPTCHRVYGEATAILAAIALMNRAYDVVAADPALTPAVRVEVTRMLAASIGPDGLTGGQEGDLHGTGDGPVPTVATVEWIHARKTGALFAAATAIGTLVAGQPPASVAAMHEFGMRLGLAFQAYDDLLDARATADAAGKDVARDGGKATLVRLLGLEAAAANADAQMTAALACVPDLDRPPRLIARYVDALMAALKAPSLVQAPAISGGGGP